MPICPMVFCACPMLIKLLSSLQNVSLVNLFAQSAPLVTDFGILHVWFHTYFCIYVHVILQINEKYMDPYSTFNLLNLGIKSGRLTWIKVSMKTKEKVVLILIKKF